MSLIHVGSKSEEPQNFVLNDGAKSFENVFALFTYIYTSSLNLGGWLAVLVQFQDPEIIH